MNRKSIILSSLALAILSFGVIADPPESANAARRAEADASIQRDVIAVIQSRASLAQNFSRVMIPKRTQDSFTVAYVESAPEGITSTPVQLPFEVRRTAPDTKGAAVVFVAGYYDTNSKSVQLFDATAKKYTVAGEHPFIKARLVKKPS
jgi:hypothetical protein